MSVKGIIMFLGMNNTRLERKILIILDFENGFLPTYLPLWNIAYQTLVFHAYVIISVRVLSIFCKDELQILSL